MPKIVIVLFFFLIQTLVSSATELPDRLEIDDAKRELVGMRLIGHELLLALGNEHSRVMPIKQHGNQYIIPFEDEWCADPSLIIHTVDSVMVSADISKDYILELKRCADNEIVHSWSVGPEASKLLIPCTGRAIPKDCYTLSVWILDNIKSDSFTNANNIQSNTQDLIFTMISLFFLSMVIFQIYRQFGIRYHKLKSSDHTSLRIGDFDFNKEQMLLTHVDGSNFQLSHKETLLLDIMARRENQVLEKAELLSRVWGNGDEYVGRTLDVFISKLRKKLSADPKIEITNIRGVGYKLLVK